MNKEELIKTAQDLVTDSRGILAADESASTIKKRFDKIGVESTPENHRRYRELLFETPKIEDYIGGVIMFDETIRQTGSDGKAFPSLLSERGIMPGIKLDKGKVPMPNFPGEEITEGLDGLSERIAEYKAMGARFAKWRTVYTISDQTPTSTCMKSNAEVQARYAASCQEQGIVPIVEPEVLMEGGHTIERCAEVTTEVLTKVFEKLADHKVILEATIIKANMVVPGKDNSQKADIKKIAEMTVSTMKKAISVAIPSIVFLSGGLSPEDSTAYLDAINELGPHPWELNFSFGRALQEPVLEAWQGKDENIPIAQKEFLKRAKLNSLALRGEYKKEMESIKS